MKGTKIVKQINKDRCFLVLMVLLMGFVLVIGFLTIKEMPATSTLAPIYEMGYSLRPF